MCCLVIYSADFVTDVVSETDLAEEERANYSLPFMSSFCWCDFVSLCPSVCMHHYL